MTGPTLLPLELDTPPSPWPNGPGRTVRPGDPVAGPALLRTEFDLDAPADLHLDTHGWGKGMVWLNGFHLGRYWRHGPQRTLYVPGPVTLAGTNELVVLETDVMIDPAARFVARPDLGPTEE